MIRILLPLAIVAAIYWGPMFSVETSDAIRGDKTEQVTGEYFIKNSIDCLIKLKAPIGKECASDGVMNDSLMVGQFVTWASMLALVAAVLSIVGLIPFIGRLTSAVTILAGLGAVGAMGLLALTMIGTPEGLPGLKWGAYLAAAMGLLTLISGLAGLRGR